LDNARFEGNAYFPSGSGLTFETKGINMKNRILTLALSFAVTLTANAEDQPKTKCPLNPAPIEISITEHIDPWHNVSGEREKKSTSYTLLLKNQSKTNLSDLRLAFCIYRNRRHDGEEYVSSEIISRYIGELAPEEKTEQKIHRSHSFREPDFLNEVIGACFRIYRKTPNGEILVAEKRSPESLLKELYPWKDVEPEK
jgi:hypothetical protein